jgi:hypothetical protein
MSSNFKVGWEKFWGTGIGLVLILIIWAVLKYMGWEIPRFNR